jgi:hypothetical protein
MYIRRPGQLPIGQTAKARSGYRVQSLRKGRDRQCRTHPKHAASSELVKIALPFYTAVGLTKSALRLTRNDQSQDDGSVQEARCPRPDEQFRPVPRQNSIRAENGLT